MKVLFVVPYPVSVAASQRFRVEQWLPVLRQQSIKYKIAPFWSAAAWVVLYKPGHTLQKTAALAVGLLKRLLLLPALPKYDFVFVHREATPVGPPWFEWLASKVFRKKLIYDFDDALWLENTTAHNKLAVKLKWPQKVAAICQWSYKISCGNHFILDFAKTYNAHALYLPTVVDTQNRYHTLKEQATEKVVIGWIGSHSTLAYLNLLEPVLQELEAKYDFDFLVVADRKPALQLQSLKYKVWQATTEIQDLLQMNIGIMPLPDTEWAKGKCAFKALQYMALGIPAVVSAVGANVAAVPDGQAGYTCATPQQWYERLEQLLLQPALRAEMGQKGRSWVQAHYDVQAHRHTFCKLFT